MELKELLKRLNKKQLAQELKMNYERIRNLASGKVAVQDWEETAIREYVKNLS